MSNRSCMVAFCKSKGTIPGISYFQLTESRYHAWLEALGLDPSREKISIHNRVCSVHFAIEDMTITPRGKTLLKSGAIPKLKLGPNVEIRKSLIEGRNLRTVRELTDQFNIDPIHIKEELQEEEIVIKSEDENDFKDSMGEVHDQMHQKTVPDIDIIFIKEELQEEEVTVKSEDL